MFYGNIGNKRVAFLEGLLCAKDIASQFTKESYLIPPHHHHHKAGTNIIPLYRWRGTDLESEKVIAHGFPLVTLMCLGYRTLWSQTTSWLSWMFNYSVYSNIGSA